MLIYYFHVVAKHDHHCIQRENHHKRPKVPYLRTWLLVQSLLSWKKRTRTIDMGSFLFKFSVYALFFGKAMRKCARAESSGNEATITPK